MEVKCRLISGKFNLFFIDMLQGKSALKLLAVNVCLNTVENALIEKTA